MNLRNSILEYGHFVKDHKVDALLLLLLALVNAFYPLPKEASISLPILIFLFGSLFLFMRHKKGKRQEQFNKYANKLRVLVAELKDKIVDSSNIYSLPNIALKIANDPQIINKTEAWNRLLLILFNKLVMETNTLNEKIEKSTGDDFPYLMTEFARLLGNLSEFKREFYNMIKETRNIAPLGFDQNFKLKFHEFREQYNGYMDKISLFSDDLKADPELRWEISKELFEHIKDLNELYRLN
jgi:hypothetical protein